MNGMANRIFLFKIFIIFFSLIIDLYAFVAIYTLMKDQGYLFKLIITIVFWSVTALIILSFLLVFRFDSGERDPAGLSNIFLLMGLFLLIYLPKMVLIGFRGLEDIMWLSSWAVKYVTRLITNTDLHVVRWTILSKTGLALSVVPFIAILWGLVFGRFHYKVEEQEIAFKNLPASLDGLKIVQVSDIHLGSIYGKAEKFQHAIDRINALHPDLILFTGDLVNNFTEEAHGWEKQFSTIQARLGKYSILGNHDYGDYWTWKSEEEKQGNLEMLYKVHEEMGFHLLKNEWDTLHIHGNTLAIVGVENWGQPPFKQYGDLAKSLRNLPDVDFKILLSHDPTHWDAQVLEKTDIPLTLSGHTHAMQFGIKIGKFKWSPSKFIYKRWMGLYSENGQALYVNRGLGFIGFPGRIGHRPEITLITLKKDKLEQ
jgi:predicted MPP superfamily phosphohydrolase